MTDKETDFKLIERFKSGDDIAFNLLVKKYQQRVYWHARRMVGNHIDADEVVQEVLLVLFKKLKDFQFRSSFYTYLYKIVSTRCLNYIAKQKIKRLFSFDELSNEIKNRSDIAEQIENNEQLEIIDKLLKKLPAKQREVFVLRHYDNLTYEEISEITGKSIGGLKANFHHAFLKIDEMFRKEYER